MNPRYALIVLLLCSNTLFVYLAWQGETNYQGMKAVADRCIVSLELVAQDLRAAIAQTGLSAGPDSIPAGWGVPATCTVGSLARDRNDPGPVYVCMAKDTWVRVESDTEAAPPLTPTTLMRFLPSGRFGYPPCDVGMAGGSLRFEDGLWTCTVYDAPPQPR